MRSKNVSVPTRTESRSKKSLCASIMTPSTSAILSDIPERYLRTSWKVKTALTKKGILSTAKVILSAIPESRPPRRRSCGDRADRTPSTSTISGVLPRMQSMKRSFRQTRNPMPPSMAVMSPSPLTRIFRSPPIRSSRRTFAISSSQNCATPFMTRSFPRMMTVRRSRFPSATSTHPACAILLTAHT